MFLRLFLLNRAQDHLRKIDIGQGDTIDFQVTSFQLFDHHCLDFARNLSALFRHRHHVIAGNHTTHRGHKLRFDNPRVKVHAHVLGQKIQLLRNGPQDDGRLNEHLQIIRTQGINVFGEALPPNIVAVHVIPGRLPVIPVLQRFGGKPFGERTPEQPSLAWLDGSSAGRCQQQSGEYKTRHGWAYHSSLPVRPRQAWRVSDLVIVWADWEPGCHPATPGDGWRAAPLRVPPLRKTALTAVCR